MRGPVTAGARTEHARTAGRPGLSRSDRVVPASPVVVYATVIVSRLIGGCDARETTRPKTPEEDRTHACRPEEEGAKAPRARQRLRRHEAGSPIWPRRTLLKGPRRELGRRTRAERRFRTRTHRAAAHASHPRRDRQIRTRHFRRCAETLGRRPHPRMARTRCVAPSAVNGRLALPDARERPSTSIWTRPRDTPRGFSTVIS